MGLSLLAGVLVFVLFISALASASPFLHAWLHADHHAPAHACVVTALQYGQSEAPVVRVTMSPALAEIPEAAWPADFFFVAHETKVFPERGPPLS